MSISHPKLTNPCQKFIEYAGGEGEFYTYDKEAEKKIPIPMPIYFVVIDELSTITGFNEKHSCGIFANEIHSILNETLRVRTFKPGVSIVGKYKDISDEVKSHGGKFTKSVYVMLFGKDVIPELANFKFKGAAFNGWIDKKFDVTQFSVGIMGVTEEKKGKNTYFVPVFKKFKLSDALLEEAVKIDNVLQAYLKEYKAQAPEDVIAKAEAVEEGPQAKDGFVKENLKREDLGGKLYHDDDVEEPPFMRD
jgi:hypothetical protein